MTFQCESFCRNNFGWNVVCVLWQTHEKCLKIRTFAACHTRIHALSAGIMALITPNAVNSDGLWGVRPFFKPTNITLFHSVAWQLVWTNCTQLTDIVSFECCYLVEIIGCPFIHLPLQKRSIRPTKRFFSFCSAMLRIDADGKWNSFVSFADEMLFVPM